MKMRRNKLERRDGKTARLRLASGNPDRSRVSVGLGPKVGMEDLTEDLEAEIEADLAAHVRVARVMRVVPGRMPDRQDRMQVDPQDHSQGAIVLVMVVGIGSQAVVGHSVNRRRPLITPSRRYLEINRLVLARSDVHEAGMRRHAC